MAILQEIVVLCGVFRVISTTVMVNIAVLFFLRLKSG